MKQVDPVALTTQSVPPSGPVMPAENRAAVLAAGTDAPPVQTADEGVETRANQARAPGDAGIGASTEGAGRQSKGDKTIAGKNDRAHHLAMIAAPGTSRLRSAKMGRASTLPALKPKSRAECVGRCGGGTFCDPSDDLGCGGEFCGRQYDRV